MFGLQGANGTNSRTVGNDIVKKARLIHVGKPTGRPPKQPMFGFIEVGPKPPRLVLRKFHILAWVGGDLNEYFLNRIIAAGLLPFKVVLGETWFRREDVELVLLKRFRRDDSTK